jgi:NitT/TauT family transport system ATP-binding protein
MKSIILKDLSKTFKHNWIEQEVILNFSHTFLHWEITGIFWPNGSGKTTLLHLISGLETATSWYADVSKNTKTSYVFQDYRNALFPWMSIEENIWYPLLLQWYSHKEIATKIHNLVDVCKVTIDLHAYPYTLSWWQQQLVNIMRSIITEPDFLLLDEPFASLDYMTREYLYAALQRIFLTTGIGVILVSHDIDEVIRMSTNIMLLTKKPMTIKASLLYNEAYPREKQVMYSPLYIQQKRKVLEQL